MSDVIPTIRKYCDVAHLRNVLSRTSWKSELHSCDLPGEVKLLISSVTKKSKLWNSEKTSVTRELIAHFQDGIQSGQSISNLNQDFGDPAVTAELIRRSKIRNRPMLAKMLRVTGIGLAGVLASYLLVTAYFHLGKPTPNIDYVAQLNRVVSTVDEQDKAWPIYRPLWTKYGFGEGGNFQLEEIFYVNPDDESDHRMIRPTDPGWQVAVERLSQYEDLLEAFRRGAKLPYLGIELQADPTNYSDEDFAAIIPNRDKANYEPWGENDGWDEKMVRLMKGSTITVILYHVQVFRKAARMFAVDTRIAVEQGDTVRATENIKTTFGLARHAAEGECLVCGLVGISIAGIGFDQIEEILENDPLFFSQQQLADIQECIEQISVRDWIHLEGERAMLHDMVQRIYTDDGKGDGRMTPEGVRILTDVGKWWRILPDKEEFGFNEILTATRSVSAPATMFLCASRNEMIEKGDELIDCVKADFEKPYWSADHPDFDQFLENNRIKYHLLSVMFLATPQVRNAMDRTIGRQEGVIAALAIHTYFLQYGQWPHDYADVSPEFVAEFPVDQVNGGLLKFTYEDDELLVYSVGNDRDDDGGKDRVFEDQVLQRSDFIFGPKREMPDGDWIVWPQRDLDR